MRLITCLPLVSLLLLLSQIQMAWQKIETAWHETHAFLNWSNIAGIRNQYNHKHANKRCNGFGITVWGLRGCNLIWSTFSLHKHPQSMDSVHSRRNPQLASTCIISQPDLTEDSAPKFVGFVITHQESRGLPNSITCFIFQNWSKEETCSCFIPICGNRNNAFLRIFP